MCFVITSVVLSKHARRGLEKVPIYIAVKLQDWIEDVEERGLEQVRSVPSYHDEPLKGKLLGYRSIRLSKGYRAYYRIIGNKVRFVSVERVVKHEY